MSSPRTPRHSPHPSLDYSAASFGSYSPQQDRRQSKASSFNDSTIDLGTSPGDGGGGGGGLGNLADELAGAFSDGEDGDYDEYEEGGYDDEGADGQRSEGLAPGINFKDATPLDAPAGQGNGILDSGADVHSPTGSAQAYARKGSLGPPAPNGRGHRRMGSEYDGSEYGDESDLESPGFSHKLVEKMGEVEALARRGTGNNGSPADGTFERLTESLRDLGSQAGVESSASRYISPFSSLPPHRHNHHT